MNWRIGVDSGGTFTDICLFDESTGRIHVWKVPSTPDDPSLGITRGVEQSLQRVDASPHAVSYFGHGTTIATNALIEHRGVPTGLITTGGFRDLLEIGRQRRPSLYDLQADKPPTLVPRELRFEVRERMRHDGTVEVKLDEEELRKAARQLRASGVKAVAICFLYGFLRTDHEQRARQILDEELPEVFVCTSHEVAPEFREYERLSTTVVNAYLGPGMERYIRQIGVRLTKLGVKATPHVTQSNGGVTRFDQASRLAVRTILSGPSTGVVAAQAIGRATGYQDLITFDMGGTSTDVALLDAGECRLASESIVHGYPIKAPMLDIHVVGAGGGSIAFVDNGGLLKVGPRSAGADPGPVCYDRGNAELTVTDANVVLQTLNPESLLGGRMPIRKDLARRAIAGLAGRLQMDEMATAQGIVAVVVASMARAIRVISVQRGYDPRDYALLAFGGAGPLHAARLAQELEIRRVIVPRNPGIACAMGLLLTDLRADFATTRVQVLSDGALPALQEALGTVLKQAQAWFDEEGIAPEARRVTRIVDMRYAGQNYEIQVTLPDGPLDKQMLAVLAERFAEAHQRLYGFLADGDPVQMITFRAQAVGLVPKATFRPEPQGDEDASGALTGTRNVWMPETAGFATCPVYDRDKLAACNRISGPAIVEQMDATTLILPGMTAMVEPYMNLVLEFS